MSPNLLKHLERLLEAELGRAKVEARGAALRSAGAIAALVLSLAAGGFLGIGVFLALLPHYGPLVASLLVAAGLLVVGALVLAICFLVLDRRAKRRARAEVAMARAAVAGDVSAFLTGLQAAGVSPVVAGLAALVAGVVAGASGGEKGEG